MLDLAITGGTLVDGTGTAARRADVGVREGRVAEVAPPGGLREPAGASLDASECIVTPGFVDVHTHYDGQATWDALMAPSSWHGVTTVVMGNCGVGFAPARRDRHAWLIELMEGVEDIPGTALSAGIRWEWESFPEYVAALEALPRTLDVAAQVPHGAVRAYVMGERGTGEAGASAEDLARMGAIVREGVAAGALAFSTNRLPMHTSRSGVPVPGTFAPHAELLALCEAVRAAGGGLVQAVPAGSMGEDRDAPLREVELYRRLSLETGRAITFTLAQVHANPDQWRRLLERVEAANAAGARLVPQVQGRPGGLLASWDTFNPFMARPSCRALADLPLDVRVAQLREPGVRAAILAEGSHDGPAMAIMRHSLHSAFPMQDGPVFEPEPELSIAGRAKREGREPEAVLYDALCEQVESSPSGRSRMLHVYFTGYANGSLGDLHAMLMHPDTVMGLSDGGAHCSMLCDASLPTFALVHWVRDRSRGPRIPLERMVAMLSRDTAELYGLRDRGRVAPGLRADLNVIDLARLRLEVPEIASDLPTGARRVVQRAAGYAAPLCAGELTFRDGRETGARPGRVVRGARSA